MQAVFHIFNDFSSLIYAEVCPSLRSDIINIDPKWKQLTSNRYSRVQDGRVNLDVLRAPEL